MEHQAFGAGEGVGAAPPQQSSSEEAALSTG